MEKPKKLPKLSKKQKDFVKDYVLSGNGQESALNNYNIKGKDKENIARSIASENLTKPNVALAIEIKTETLKSALEKKGITPDKIADKINVLLDASKPIFKNNNATGEIEQVGEEIDYIAVDKGLKHAKEIYGVEDSDKPKENIYNFFFEPKFQQNIRNFDENLKNLILNKDETNK